MNSQGAYDEDHDTEHEGECKDSFHDTEPFLGFSEKFEIDEI